MFFQDQVSPVAAGVPTSCAFIVPVEADKVRTARKGRLHFPGRVVFDPVDHHGGAAAGVDFVFAASTAVQELVVSRLSLTEVDGC